MGFKMVEFTGRVKSLDFISGRVDIANKEKDYFFVRSSRFAELCALVSNRPYITFMLDGKIIEDFNVHSY